MSQTIDVQQYLNSLLVTDRRCLIFLYQTVFGQKGVQSLEQASAELAGHVRRSSGQAPNALKRWLQTPGSVQSRYRQALIRLIGFYRDPSVTDDLLGILRQLTFVASHPAAITALAQAQGIRASRILTDLLWSAPVHQWHVRETAILRELGKLGWTSSVDHLIKALSVPYDNPVRAAAGALARFEADDVLPPLQKILEDGGVNSRQTAGAAEALGRLGDKRATPILQRASRATDPAVATAAAVALARLGDPNAEARLVRLAYADRGHAGAEMRARALGALGILAQNPDQVLGEDAFNTLYQGLGDSQPEVRSEAAQSLGKADRPSASRHISEALRREVSPLVRSAMIRALGQLGHGRSVEVLLEYLRRDGVSVKIEVLSALANFKDPTLARHITPYRAASDPRLVEAANRALRLLLHRPFVWPAPAAIEGAPVSVHLYTLKDARHLLLPPAPPPPKPGFFGRLFGTSIPEPEPPPTPVGKLTLSSEGASLELSGAPAGARWEQGQVGWATRFSLQVTREPIEESGEGEQAEDIGVHFVLRQRDHAAAGAVFKTVAVSLWCAPSEAIGRLPAKSERFPCMDPHMAEPFLAALRWYMEVHGEPLGFV